MFNEYKKAEVTFWTAEVSGKTSTDREGLWGFLNAAS